MSRIFCCSYWITLAFFPEFYFMAVEEEEDTQISVFTLVVPILGMAFLTWVSWTKPGQASALCQKWRIPVSPMRWLRFGLSWFICLLTIILVPLQQQLNSAATYRMVSCAGWWLAESWMVASGIGRCQHDTILVSTALWAYFLSVILKNGLIDWCLELTFQESVSR